MDKVNHGYLLKTFSYDPKTGIYGSGLGYNDAGKKDLAKGVGELGDTFEAKEIGDEKSSYKNPLIIYNGAKNRDSLFDNLGYYQSKHFGFSANGIADPVYSYVPLSYRNDEYANLLNESNVKYLPEYIQGIYQRFKDYGFTHSKAMMKAIDVAEDEAYSDINKNGRIKGKLSRFGAQAAPGFKFSEHPNLDLLKRVIGYAGSYNNGKFHKPIVLIQAPIDSVLSLDTIKNRYSAQRDSPNEMVFTKGTLLKDLDVDSDLIQKLEDFYNRDINKKTERWKFIKKLQDEFEAKYAPKTVPLASVLAPDSEGLSIADALSRLDSLADTSDYDKRKGDFETIELPAKLKKWEEEYDDKHPIVSADWLENASKKLLREATGESNPIILSDKDAKFVAKDLSNFVNSKLTQGNILKGLIDE